MYLCFQNGSTKWSKSSRCLVSTTFFGNVVRVSQNLGICFALIFSESIYPLTTHSLTHLFFHLTLTESSLYPNSILNLAKYEDELAIGSPFIALSI